MLRRPGEGAHQEFAAMAQPFLVDAVADALRQVPLDRKAKRGEPARGMKQRLRRDEIVAVAMHEQDRRARFDLGRKAFGVAVGRHAVRCENFP